MPRQPRCFLPGFPQHVVQRGNNRQPVFFRSSDYLVYLEQLAAACRMTGCALHCYVLMGNHTHLLITSPDKESLSAAMKAINQNYAQYLNHRYQRSGSPWDGRYKASLVDTEEYFFACCRYIELNPVRAGIARNPGNYPWSSYRYHAYGEADDLIAPHPSYLSLARYPEARQRQYRALFKSDLRQDVLEDIRTAIQSEAVLGGNIPDEVRDGMASPVMARYKVAADPYFT